MKDFQFKIPQTIEFGMGSLKKLPEMLADSKSDNVMLVSDRGLEAIGVVKKVQDIIEAAGIKCTSYLDVKPNPTVDIVNEAAALYKECGATCLVALGGGSPMDVSKAVGILAVHGGQIADYEGPHKVPGPIAPIIAIPTTAGTGSEVTASAVITDEERNFKMSVFTYYNIPKYAILDPELIMTAPASIAAACGVDALIHAMEAYLSTAATPFSDAMAEKAMELIGANLRRFVANRKDEEAACAMMLGSNFAGISFAWARLGDIHSMSHPVSAYYPVAHGVANAILLPTVMEFNAPCTGEKYREIAKAMGVEGTENMTQEEYRKAAVEAVSKLSADVGIPADLKEIVKREDLDFLAQSAFDDACRPGNPRATSVEEIKALYESLL